ncbi:MAG: NAD(P)H-hydrate dehydratase [Clostridia bacterium]|nr:NAD(P)H-hydrate dehydratase [Clostridia bacterium]
MLYDDSWRFCYDVLTPEEMRRTEQKAFALGVPSLLLMEHAAIAVIDELEKALGGSCKQKRVLFLCGTGNNGGDGLAAARLFAMRGGKPTVYLTGEPKTPDAKTNRVWAEKLGVPVLNLREMPEKQLPFREAGFAENFDGAVDALLGTGLRGEPDALTSGLIHAAASDFARRKPVIAVDIPSGIDGTTGDAPGARISANVTVTFHAPKPGLYLTEKRDSVGKIVTADIGLWGMFDLQEMTYDPTCRVFAPPAIRLLHARKRTAHKGDSGRVLIYAGKLGMAGAAAMCAKAAVTAGAGLSTIACEKEIIPILQTLVPNAMCMDIQDAIKNPPACDVFAVGCGLGQSEAIWQSILRLWNPEKPSVWDADALNLLSRHEMKLRENAVITPHPGEASRLLGWPMEKIMADRLETARALAEKYGCTAVLKSDVTVICKIEEGKPKYYLNTVGSPALAKGGSGDALTGILAALLHDLGPMETLEQSALACLWHGMAGVVGEEKYGQRELTTDQLISCLHEAERWGRGEIPAPQTFQQY